MKRKYKSVLWALLLIGTMLTVGLCCTDEGTANPERLQRELDVEKLLQEKA